MQQFLKLVADVYCRHERENLLDYCFIFPNKRSSTFFTDYLRQAMRGAPFIMPQIMSMTDFVASFSDLIEASRYEQLFTLYRCYDRLSQEIADFDKFLFWGEMLLNDFNDVDSYMVDPERLFVNVKRLKEINANYFTPEQIDIIKRYWGELPEGYDPEVFWTHIGVDKEVKAGERFLKLWQILYPLYNDFHASLEKEGLTNRGRLYRHAAGEVARCESFHYKRYIFVGFNVLSTSEFAIFERLKARGVADFYWDYASPAFEVKGNRASRFMARNVELFPSRFEIEQQEPSVPEIEIVGIPSRVGQAKFAGNVLSRWVEEGVISKPDDAINTAVVLPDEYLFIPLIHSLPETIDKVNITMGYPMKHTPIAALLSSIVSMHLNSRFVDGDVKYFYEDILKVVTHPIILSVFEKEAVNISSTLTAKRLFTVSSGELAALGPSLKAVFAQVKDSHNFDQVYNYTVALLGLLSRALTDNTPLERMFLESCLTALATLREAVGRYGITMRESTFFQLLERALAGESVRFEGEPLKGLQIMGVLETRSLDFDNIIFLSMNERIFPRKHFSRSFIPETLRRAYGLSTTDFQESIYAYLFYRLITRAKRVTLVYDGRNIGGKSSEMSRYLTQLLYIYNRGNVSHAIYNYQQSAFTPPTIDVVKSPQIMKKLERYTVAKSGKNLSASSINDYINCPLNFYLKYVEGYNPDNELVDYMDFSTYGTVLHEVAEHLYRSKLAPGAPIPPEGILITDDDIDRFLKTPTLIDSLIVKSINKNYFNRGDSDTTPLHGETEVLGRVMKMFVVNMLELEREFTPMMFIAAEHEIETQMKVNDTLRVNIKQFIDRVDRVNIDRQDGGLLRLVDYKTGSDKLDAKSFDELFDPTIKDRRKAMLQLFFYCNAYTGFATPPGPVQPIIYSFNQMKKFNKIEPLKMDGTAITDYRPLNDGFKERFMQVVEEIFDPDVPFSQGKNAHACTFCNFKQICSRPES